MKKKIDDYTPLVPLQWFAEEEEGDVPGPDPNQMGFSEVEAADDYEITYEGEEGFEEEEKGPSREELLQALAEKEALIRSKPETADVLAEKLDVLTERLTPKPPPVDYKKLREDERKKFNSDFLNDPYANLEELLVKKLAPELRKNMQNTGTLKLAKKMVLQDESNKKVYNKYTSEVEQNVKEIIQRSPHRVSDPDVYDEALKKTQSNHIEDLVEDLVNERVQKALSNAKPGNNFSLNTGNSAPGNSGGTRKKLRITNEQRIAAAAKSRATGIPIDKVIATLYGGE